MLIFYQLQKHSRTAFGITSFTFSEDDYEQQFFGSGHPLVRAM